MVHVAAVDAPVTQADVKAIAREAWKALGMGKKEEAAADREEAALKPAALRLNPKSAERGEDAAARLNPRTEQEAAPAFGRQAKDAALRLSPRGQPETAGVRSDAETEGRQEAGLKPGATLTPLKAGVDILGWEFALEVNELAKQIDILGNDTTKTIQIEV